MKWMLLFVLIVPFTFALDITEIMYNPGSELGGNYNEWVEIYSEGEFTLNNYKINGKDIDNITIKHEYLVIAENAEKFEEYFGNNNSIFDEGYKIVDASSFSLDDNQGIVNISDGVNEFVVEYLNELGNGNGKTIEYFNGSWVESLGVKGTPGEGRENSNGIFITLEVTDDVPDILNIEILSDESDQEGIQVFPEAGRDKEIIIRVNASEYEYILVEFDNETINTDYEAKFNLPYYREPGNYSINISVIGNDLVNSKIISFEYMELVAFDFFPDELNFNQIEKGKSVEEFVGLENKGNVVLDFSMNSNGLSNGDELINSSYLENGYDGNWSSLGNILDVNLQPNDFDELQIKVNVPEVQNGIYSGLVELFGVKG